MHSVFGMCRPDAVFGLGRRATGIGGIASSPGTTPGNLMCITRRCVGAHPGREGHLANQGIGSSALRVANGQIRFATTGQTTDSTRMRLAMCHLRSNQVRPYGLRMVERLSEAWRIQRGCGQDRKISRKLEMTVERGGSSFTNRMGYDQPAAGSRRAASCRGRGGC